MLTGAVGCAMPERGGAAESKTDSMELARTEQLSVYGVEAPDGADVSALGGEVVQTAQTAKTSEPETQVLAARAPNEVRGIWLSYLTLDPMIKGKSKAQFTKNLDAAFKKIDAMGLNTVFMHVRPFGDAFYDSAYYPWSSYITGEEGVDPGYDPLEVMCTLARKHGLRIEAWLNPYRVRNSAKPLSKDNPAKKWLDEGNDAAIEWDGGVSLNPASADARKLIVNGVKEIVENYDVDGIHFDDYFYPTTSMDFDSESYKKSGSSKSQADWRRDNVNKLVREVYAAVKAADPSCLFGISPQGNIDINYNGQFADVEKWVSTTGYVDYIAPQIYFGYNHKTVPYAETLQRWDDMITAPGIDLYIGLAAYKLGIPDPYAGAGENDWVDTKNVLSKMVKTARGADNYSGVILYSYDSLFTLSSAQIKAEYENLTDTFR